MPTVALADDGLDLWLDIQAQAAGSSKLSGPTL